MALRWMMSRPHQLRCPQAPSTLRHLWSGDIETVRASIHECITRRKLVCGPRLKTCQLKNNDKFNFHLAHSMITISRGSSHSTSTREPDAATTRNTGLPGAGGVRECCCNAAAAVHGAGRHGLRISVRAGDDAAIMIRQQAVILRRSSGGRWR